MSKSVTFERVSKSFEHRGRTVQALDDVSLTIEPGDIHAIVGYSGAGKSTLLRTVNALERPTSGAVFVGDQEISALRGKHLLAARQRIGMVFQQFNLLRSRSVYKNIAYPLRLAGLSESETIDRVEELLEFVDLSDKALQYPASCPAGRSSAWASPVRSPPARTCSSPTRRRVRWTRRRPSRSWACSSGSTRSTG